MKRTIHGWTLTLLAASRTSSSVASAQQQVTDARLQELIRVAAARAGVSPQGASSQAGPPSPQALSPPQTPGRRCS